MADFWPQELEYNNNNKMEKTHSASLCFFIRSPILMVEASIHRNRHNMNVSALLALFAHPLPHPPLLFWTNLTCICIHFTTTNCSSCLVSNLTPSYYSVWKNNNKKCRCCKWEVETKYHSSCSLPLIITCFCCSFISNKNKTRNLCWNCRYLNQMNRTLLFR